MKKIIGFLIFTIFFPVLLLAQHVPSSERVDFSYRRKTDISANLVRTSVFNRVITGREGENPEQIPYEWPKNSSQRYMALTSLMCGGVATLKDGQKIKIFEAGLGKGENNTTGDSYDFNPVPDYLNLDSPDIANYNDPDSWPAFWPNKMDDPLDPGWPGAWNGIFGKDQSNADQELFFRAGDDHYDKFNYYPDSTDETRYGMGLLIDTRVLQWTQVLVQDVTFIIHYIKNDGDKDLERFGVSVLLADLVGGDGDSDDDVAFYDLREEIAWSTDSDGIGNEFFGDDPVGVVATTFLETPGNHLDHIDNDFDGEEGSPKITEAMLSNEDPTNGIDDNGNGLIDENKRNTPFDDLTGSGPGSAYKDYIDNNGNGELNSPVVSTSMLTGEIPGNAIGDINLFYADGIDNDDSYLVDVGINHGEMNSPVITQEIVDEAAQDQNKRYFVPGTNIVLYNVGAEDLGKAYRDGIDNDNDGAIDEGIDEGIDEMIDERRNDALDNDGDWNVNLDDVGADGDAGTGDRGENDGKPTPGEPNIDETDVSESDQIGLTNAQYSPSDGFTVVNDAGSYRLYLTPGSFYTTQPQTSDFNLFIGSGLFRLVSGNTERISMAIAMGVDSTDALRNRKNSLSAYASDYQFFQAPFTPQLTAVPGDRKVTLYWDDSAEQSFDRLRSRLGLDPYDFEGYRIYRSTEAAFKDPEAITDVHGVPVFKKPLAQFDLVDEWEGIHPISPDGAHFYLGNNTGLRHTYVDSPVVNGQRYFYVLTAYDFGMTVEGEVRPTESNYKLNKTSSGDFEYGPSVAIVTPNAKAAGYVDAYLVNGVEHVSGASFSEVDVNILDPTALLDGQRYRVTFEDTTLISKSANISDTIKTSNFTLAYVNTNGSAGDTLINRQKDFNITDIAIDGFNLKFRNVEQVRPDLNNSFWNTDSIHSNPDSLHPFEYRVFMAGFIKGKKVPYDYDILFGGPGYGQSSELDIGRILPSIPVNFKIFNRTLDKEIEFGFIDRDVTGTTDESAYFTRTKTNRDIIIFIEEVEEENTITWLLTFDPAWNENLNAPQDGDVLHLATEKPFLRDDVYEFTIQGAKTDIQKAKNELDDIRVVPNPYIVATPWEPLNPYRSGRGPQEIHFNHLPRKCTIRIFTVTGELVRKIEHDVSAENGTAVWDVLTRDQLAVAYGIYIYHIDAPDIGTKIGRLAIIK